MAERQGFEPWEGYPSTVFKTVGANYPQHLTVIISGTYILGNNRQYCYFWSAVVQIWSKGSYGIHGGWFLMHGPHLDQMNALPY